MKAPNFSFFEPATLEDAIKFKSSDKNSVYLAGGQSLMPALNMRLSTPSCLIDINKLEELKKINIGNDYIEIGALCTHSKLISNIELNKHFPSLPNILRHVAHPAIRNKGTHGGSIAYADPAAELPSLALALDTDSATKTLLLFGYKIFPEFKFEFITKLFVLVFTTNASVGW